MNGFNEVVTELQKKLKPLIVYDYLTKNGYEEVFTKKSSINFNSANGSTTATTSNHQNRRGDALISLKMPELHLSRSRNERNGGTTRPKEVECPFQDCHSVKVIRDFYLSNRYLMNTNYFSMVIYFLKVNYIIMI